MDTAGFPPEPSSSRSARRARTNWSRFLEGNYICETVSICNAVGGKGLRKLLPWPLAYLGPKGNGRDRDGLRSFLLSRAVICTISFSPADKAIQAGFGFLRQPGLGRAGGQRFQNAAGLGSADPFQDLQCPRQTH
jgi:hypothetical protein